VIRLSLDSKSQFMIIFVTLLSLFYARLGKTDPKINFAIGASMKGYAANKYKQNC
jgi:hypothetical protein